MVLVENKYTRPGGPERWRYPLALRETHETGIYYPAPVISWASDCLIGRGNSVKS